MKQMAKLRYKFWRKVTGYHTLKVEAFYEIIKELIYSCMYREGYNCTNHICLIAYIRRFMEPYQVEKIDELRKIRNEISYRGFNVKKEYLERNLLEFDNIINFLEEQPQTSKLA